jgi:hypothetical protein
LFRRQGKGRREPLFLFHPEAAFALLIAVTVGVLFARAGLKLPVLPLVLAIVVFQLSVASWRVYHTQRVSIATTRSLRRSAGR